MGGPSREREVSLVSGRAVADALEARGHDVRRLDVRPGEVTPERLEGQDVAFLALHGAWGEDGGIQRELDALGVCYTGSGPEASRLAMDKPASKRRFAERGVPTPPFRLVARGDREALESAYEALGPAVVVKPPADGSSIGVRLCDAFTECGEGADAVWQSDECVLVESLVPGRELTVGVLADCPLPLIEIRVPDGWYDFQAKYESDATGYVFDHGLEPEAAERVVEVGLAAHRALGCRDLSRVDLIVPEGGEPQVLEVNTIPGFTSHSLVPKAAAQAGISFGRLCECIVALARKRVTGPAGAAVQRSQ
jgi:D-alanine-D-alanine ligase